MEHSEQQFAIEYKIGDREQQITVESAAKESCDNLRVSFEPDMLSWPPAFKGLITSSNAAMPTKSAQITIYAASEADINPGLYLIVVRIHDSITSFSARSIYSITVLEADEEQEIAPSDSSDSKEAS